MLVKIHDTYREVVAICDTNLFGKIFEEGEKQLDLTGSFFQGEEKTEKEVREIIESERMEDATFNIVGENSCRIAKEVGLIEDKGITRIQGIPIGLILM